MKPFEFQNNHSGFQKLLNHLASFPKDDLLIGMESTAHYAENLTCFLYNRGFPICIINPIQTSVIRKSKLLRYALINAAWQITFVNQTFKDYYDLKISQGHRHYGALGHVAHKLVRVIHKMLTDNVGFHLA